MPKFECWWRPIVALGVLCVSLSQEARAIYDVQPGEASGKPGSVIRVWPLDAGASNRFAVWGHSQGGHASLYTGELAASHAPDLKLVGVAAAAPATYLIELFDADKSALPRSPSSLASSSASKARE
jgi:hypothetical protein